MINKVSGSTVDHDFIDYALEAFHLVDVTKKALKFDCKYNPEQDCNVDLRLYKRYKPNTSRSIIQTLQTSVQQRFARSIALPYYLSK